MSFRYFFHNYFCSISNTKRKPNTIQIWTKFLYVVSRLNSSV